MSRFALICCAFLLFFTACKQEQPASASGPTAEELALWAKYTAEGWKNHGCELITDTEVETLFGFKGQEVTLNARPLPNQAFCLRTWNKPDWKERESNNEKEGAAWLNSRNRLVVQLFDYHSEEHSRQQIENL
ncbi:MAG: hypothetical protein SFV22_05880, partial [Saprospiraceae bacterium]|nr:hypothetical protein [Saprospiraceae bacterium]